jgi:NAD(P)H-hydrate epimerase
MKLVSVAEMKAIEQEANEKGVSYDTMMERAGNGVARIIHRFYSPDRDNRITALVGSGNNGGDALVALTALNRYGWKTMAYLAGERKNDKRLEEFQAEKGEVKFYQQDENSETLRTWLSNSDILLDGLLGTGFRLPLKTPYKEILHTVQIFQGSYKTIAVDCPSGVDCDSGETADESLTADLTICLQAVKVGLLSFPAYQCVGLLEVVDLDLPPELKAEEDVKREVATSEFVRRLLPKRPLQSHKGTFGTALIVAGSINYPGAAFFAGMAAYRIGAGLVKMAVPGPIYSALVSQFPEATWLVLPHDLGIIQSKAAAVIQNNLDKVTALLLGPGWGREETTKEFLEKIISGKSRSEREKNGIGFVMMENDEEEILSSNLPPMVIDADGLKLLEKLKNWPQCLPSKTILTPHPGEMAVLTNLTIQEIQTRRLEIASEFSKKWGHIIVLKGALTIIAAPDGRLSIVPVANPALARAGTGDVLAGIITGMVAQGVKPFDAAVAGVWIHAQAGIEASEKVGHPAAVLAGDVLNAIPTVLARLG